MKQRSQRGGTPQVILGLGFAGHRDFVYCVQRDGRWVEAASGNEPTIGWDNPDQIDWLWVRAECRTGAEAPTQASTPTWEDPAEEDEGNPLRRSQHVAGTMEA